MKTINTDPLSILLSSSHLHRPYDAIHLWQAYELHQQKIPVLTILIISFLYPFDHTNFSIK